MSAAPTSNGVFVVIPPSNASGLRPPPAILPTSVCQPPGIMQFEEPPLGAQTPRTTQPPDWRPVETFLTGEPKALGFIISGSLSVAAEKNHTSCLPVIFLPSAFSADFNIPSPAASPPPAYDNVAYAQGDV
uniref:Membrane spanning 4-domains A15 n=1 Tax=Saimiri boliviensis boliviensis TaxID=39432 RepID=A0A2K6TXJ9_SAIBB